jgi:hypothetical protein
MPFHALSSFNDVMTFCFFFLSLFSNSLSLCSIFVWLGISWPGFHDGLTDKDICGKIRLFCCCFGLPDSISLVFESSLLFFPSFASFLHWPCPSLASPRLR